MLRDRTGGIILNKNKSFNSTKEIVEIKFKKRMPIKKRGKGRHSKRKIAKITYGDNVVVRSADDVNAEFPPDWFPPYKPGTNVYDYINNSDDTFVRVWSSWEGLDNSGNIIIKNNENGHWLMKIEDIIDSKGNFLSARSQGYFNKGHQVTSCTHRNKKRFGNHFVLWSFGGFG